MCPPPPRAFAFFSRSVVFVVYSACDSFWLACVAFFMGRETPQEGGGTSIASKVTCTVVSESLVT